MRNQCSYLLAGDGGGGAARESSSRRRPFSRGADDDLRETSVEGRRGRKSLPLEEGYVWESGWPASLPLSLLPYDAVSPALVTWSIMAVTSCYSLIPYCSAAGVQEAMVPSSSQTPELGSAQGRRQTLEPPAAQAWRVGSINWLLVMLVVYDGRPPLAGISRFLHRHLPGRRAGATTAHAVQEEAMRFFCTCVRAPCSVSNNIDHLIPRHQEHSSANRTQDRVTNAMMTGMDSRNISFWLHPLPWKGHHCWLAYRPIHQLQIT